MQRNYNNYNNYSNDDNVISLHVAAQETRPQIAVWAIALFMSVMHGLNLIVLLANAHFYGWLICHFALAIITFFITAIINKNANEDSRFLQLLSLVSLPLGIFGTLGVLLSLIRIKSYLKRALSFEQWRDFIFPPLVKSLAQNIDESLLSGRDEAASTYQVTSFYDVILYGNEAQKRQALTRMTMNFSPVFAPCFLRALQDSSPTIRVQAATSIVRIEHEFTQKTFELEAAYKKNQKVSLALANHYDEYAFTGLLDGQRAQEYREKALKLYSEAFAQGAGRNERTRLIYGRLLMRSDMLEDAIQWFNQCIKTGDEPSMIVPWLAESLYAAQKWEELREISRRFHTQLTGGVGEALQYCSAPAWARKAVAL